MTRCLQLVFASRILLAIILNLAKISTAFLVQTLFSTNIRAMKPWFWAILALISCQTFAGPLIISAGCSPGQILNPGEGTACPNNVRHLLFSVGVGIDFRSTPLKIGRFTASHQYRIRPSLHPLDNSLSGKTLTMSAAGSLDRLHALRSHPRIRACPPGSNRHLDCPGRHEDKDLGGGHFLLPASVCASLKQPPLRQNANTSQSLDPCLDAPLRLPHLPALRPPQHRHSPHARGRRALGSPRPRLRLRPRAHARCQQIHNHGRGAGRNDHVAVKGDARRELQDEEHFIWEVELAVWKDWAEEQGRARLHDVCGGQEGRGGEYWEYGGEPGGDIEGGAV